MHACIVKSVKVLMVTALFASGSALAASPKTGTADDLVDAYLAAQTTLAADKTDGIAEAMKRIERASSSIARKDKQLAASLKKEAKAVSEAKTLANAREAFKALSLSMSALAEEHYQGKRALNVFNCSMANARWVQESAGPAQNPYYGAEMLTCGEKVWPAAMGGKEDRKHQMEGHGHGH